MTEESYVEELLAFEPKMRAIVGSFTRQGFRFGIHTEDDLVQEMFLLGLEIRDLYDPDRAGLRTFWTKCFRNRLLGLAGEESASLATSLDDMDQEGCCDGDDLKVMIEEAVSNVIKRLEQEDPAMARMCMAYMDTGGDVEAVASALGTSTMRVKYGLTRLRMLPEWEQVLDSIPF